MAKKRRVKLSEQLRRAVDASGLSRYRICKEIGLLESTMSRFMSGECGLALDTLDRLADLLGLEVTTAAPAATTPTSEGASATTAAKRTPATGGTKRKGR